MKDKELLELAAKAAGIEIEENGLHWNFTQDPAELREWNPLTNDGDAFRLAVSCGIEVGNAQQYKRGVAMFYEKEFWIEDKDLYAATRRAIVRAAAEIGKGMK